MLELQRRWLHLDMRDRRQGNLTATRDGRGQIELRKRIRRACESGIHRQNDPPLIGLGEDGRNDSLPESVIEHIIDRRQCDAEACGGVSIHIEVSAETSSLRGAAHILDLRLPIQTLDERRDEVVERLRIRGLPGRNGTARDRCGVDGEILNRPKVERAPATASLPLAMRRRHLGRARLALSMRLQIDEETVRSSMSYSRRRPRRRTTGRRRQDPRE